MSGVVFIFLFKQKTAYDMRISDWSSDVCSSDLHRTVIRPSSIIISVSERHAEFHTPQAWIALKRIDGTEYSDHSVPVQHEILFLQCICDNSLCIEATIFGLPHDPKVHHGLRRSEEHTSELQPLMRISIAVFCL